eukprot:s2434_g5.t1
MSSPTLNSASWVAKFLRVRVPVQRLTRNRNLHTSGSARSEPKTVGGSREGPSITSGYRNSRRRSRKVAQI